MYIMKSSTTLHKMRPPKLSLHHNGQRLPPVLLLIKGIGPCQNVTLLTGKTTTDIPLHTTLVNVRGVACCLPRGSKVSRLMHD